MKKTLILLRRAIIRGAIALSIGLGVVVCAMPNAAAQAEAAGYLGGGNDTGTTPQSQATPPAQQGTANQASSCVNTSQIIPPQTITSFGAFVNGPISSIVNNTQSAALGISAKALPYALALGGGFALLTALSDIMFAMIRKQSIWEPVIGTVVMALIASVLLYNYNLVVGFVTGEVQDITMALTGSQDNLGMIIGALASLVTSALGIMGGALSGMCGFWSFFEHIGTFILIVIIMIVTLFFIFVAFIELFSVIILAPLMVGIGTAVGPIFVGLIASRWTQKWFLKWLEFMLAAAIINLLVGVAMALLVNIFNAIKSDSSSMTGSVMSAMGLMVLSMALGKFFQSIPGLASAMVPGHHGMSGGGSAAGAAVAELAPKGGGAGGGGAAAVAAAPSGIKAAAVPMRAVAAAIGGPAAVAAVGMMANSAQAATKMASSVGKSTASPPPTGD